MTSLGSGGPSAVVQILQFGVAGHRIEDHGMDPAPRVLAVDDERLMRMTLRHHLGELGYDVETVGTLKDALDRLDSKTYDLVLTDLNLPDGCGLEIVQYARNVNPRIRTVVLTASLGDRVTDEALEAGADAILLKPCSLHELVAETNRVLDPRIRQPGRTV